VAPAGQAGDPTKGEAHEECALAVALVIVVALTIAACGTATEKSDAPADTVTIMETQLVPAETQPAEPPTVVKRGVAFADYGIVKAPISSLKMRLVGVLLTAFVAAALAPSVWAEQLCDDGTGNIGPCNGPPAHSYISLKHLVWLVIGGAILFAIGKAAGRKETVALLASDEDEIGAEDSDG
jgi:hypothetical protein